MPRNELVHIETLDSHDNFTQIPNIVDDMPLSVYSARLYWHIRRRTSETGECWENTANLAAYCGIGKNTVTAAKQELYKSGLIVIETVKGKEGHFDYHNIIINDIWTFNHAWFAYSLEARKKAIEMMHKQKGAVFTPAEMIGLAAEVQSEQQPKEESAKNPELPKSGIEALLEQVGIDWVKTSKAKKELILNYLAEKKKKGQLLEEFISWTLSQRWINGLTGLNAITTLWDKCFDENWLRCHDENGSYHHPLFEGA